MQNRYYAVINHSSHDQTSFSLYPIHSETASHCLPGVKKFSFLNMKDEKIDKSLKRQCNRFHNLASFLQTDKLIVHKTAFVETTGQEKNKNKSLFVDMQLGEHHHFTFAQGIKSFPLPITSFSKITIFLGICLFSRQTLYAMAEDKSKVNVLSAHVTEQSSPLQYFNYDPQPSLYEVESLTRLTQFITNFVALLPQELLCDITVEVPRVHYYLFLLPLLHRNVISPFFFLKWVELVNQRHHALKNSLKEVFSACFHNSKRQKTPSITFSDDLNLIEDLIIRSVNNHKVPSLAELTEYLCSRDKFWRLVCSIDPPRTYRHLSNISYSIEVLRRSLSKKPASPRFVFNIVNSMDRKVYHQAKYYAQVLQKSEPSQYEHHLAALYPLELIFSQGVYSSLFFDEYPRKMVEQQGSEATIFDVIQKIYGISHQQIIKKNFNQYASKWYCV